MRRTRVGVLVVGVVALAGALWGVSRATGPARDAAAPPSRRTAGAGGTDLATLLQTADPARGAGVFGQCSACHSVGRNGPDLDGPNLYGVVGARLAQRRPRFGYTAALRAAGGTWTYERLDAWLTDPRRLVPGTSMPFAGLPDARDRADLIAYLNQQGTPRPLP